ncbi:hypothetical protein AURDEDRAFT_155210 [Auricularia subglabra TFB-10046 SS5]|nr:hypothetical protein AURDEDRAFT_155210 [Auricularia subglabra TFB-10046 SS5]
MSNREERKWKLVGRGVHSEPTVAARRCTRVPFKPLNSNAALVTTSQPVPYPGRGAEAVQAQKSATPHRKKIKRPPKCTVPERRVALQYNDTRRTRSEVESCTGGNDNLEAASPARCSASGTIVNAAEAVQSADWDREDAERCCQKTCQ